MANNFPIIFLDGSHDLLIIDPSSSHLAYTLINLNFKSEELNIVACGMVWVPDSYTKGKKYRYMLRALQLLAAGNKDGSPDGLVTEGFFVNPKMLMGSAVVPTINSFVCMAADELDLPFFEIGPSTWRGILGIKAVKDSDGKRDYKIPTADLVKRQITVPDTIPSNINRKQRKMPNDITDVLAIALAIGRHHGINKVSQSNTAFYPIQYLDALEQLSKEL